MCSAESADSKQNGRLAPKKTISKKGNLTSAHSLPINFIIRRWNDAHVCVLGFLCQVLLNYPKAFCLLFLLGVSHYFLAKLQIKSFTGSCVLHTPPQISIMLEIIIAQNFPPKLFIACLAVLYPPKNNCIYQ